MTIDRTAYRYERPPMKRAKAAALEAAVVRGDRGAMTAATSALT
jgi:hypothetical protein